MFEENVRLLCPDFMCTLDRGPVDCFKKREKTYAQLIEQATKRAAEDCTTLVHMPDLLKMVRELVSRKAAGLEFVIFLRP